MEHVNLTMDGKPVRARKGSTILSAALERGLDIPHLCSDPRLSPTGSCRLCMVELEGQRGIHTSCTRAAEEGMIVRIDTPALRLYRKSVLEFLLSEHRLACSTCDKDGDCLLQNYAYEYQVKEDRYPHITMRVKSPNFTSGSKAFQYDPTKCVRCQRCVKICAEVQGVEALTLRNRAGSTLVTTGFDVMLKESTCETCGQCVSTCPVGALYEKESAGRGKLKDLDRTRTTCPYCGVGCQLDLNVGRKTGRIERVTSQDGCIPNDGNTCIKGRFGLDFVASSERLRVPLIKENGEFRESSWDEALDRVAEGIRTATACHGPDAFAGLSSAKTTNEDNFVFQKFVRAGVGTNNVDHCARLCHASTVAGLARAFGSGAMTNSIEEFSRTPLIFVIGSNTTECHPVIGILIRQAVARGMTRLIVADPRRISLAEIAHIHVRQKPGTDVALINAMLHVILEEGHENKAFIRERTEDFESLLEAVKECPPELAEKLTGVSAADIRRIAREYAQAASASIVYAMGITQHTTGTDNVLALANLAMATGNIGRECSGVNPLRGQNNVQGACDMGALPDVYPGYQKVDDPETRAKFEKAWGVALPAKPGLTATELISEAARGNIKAMYIMGENPMLSDADIGHVEEALNKLDFLAVQDIFLTETARLADVVLPAFSFAEKDGSFTNTERRVQLIRRAVAAPGQSRDDWRIICDLSGRLGYPMAYAGASDILDEAAGLAPIYGGISFSRIEKQGLQWPCPSADHPGTRLLHVGKFTRGKGKFHAVRFLPARELPDDAYSFILTTGRILEHFHTGSMTRKSVVLADRVPHGSLELNPADALRLGIRNGETARVRSRRGVIQLPVNVTEKVQPGTVFLAFHFAEYPANALTIAALDPCAKIPEFKVCAVSIEKA